MVNFFAEVTAAVERLGRELKAQLAQHSLEVRERMDALTALIQSMMQTPQSSTSWNTAELGSRHALPLRDFQALKDFELEITSDPSYKDFMVSMCSSMTLLLSHGVKHCA
jgi:hypothetical protein